MNNSIKALTATGFDVTDLTAAFQPIFTLSQACIVLRFINESNIPVAISYDGSHVNDYIPANSTTQLKFEANLQPGGQAAVFPKGTVISALGIVDEKTLGTFYVVGYYQTQT
jgi:hypothetical protein